MPLGDCSAVSPVFSYEKWQNAVRNVRRVVTPKGRSRREAEPPGFPSEQIASAESTECPHKMVWRSLSAGSFDVSEQGVAKCRPKRPNEVVEGFTPVPKCFYNAWIGFSRSHRLLVFALLPH